ncbi:Kinesin- protein 12 [Entophlyctis luteolus]|nr:Kinesin- protein 12 [Entophlyctis luteolus]
MDTRTLQSCFDRRAKGSYSTKIDFDGIRRASGDSTFNFSPAAGKALIPNSPNGDFNQLYHKYLQEDQNRTYYPQLSPQSDRHSHGSFQQSAHSHHKYPSRSESAASKTQSLFSIKTIGSASISSNSSNIRVVVRIRPKTDYEISRENSPREHRQRSAKNTREDLSLNDLTSLREHNDGDAENVAISCAADGKTLFLLGKPRQTLTGSIGLSGNQCTPPTSKALTFHRVYEESVDQESVFNDCGVKDLIEQAIEGFSVTVFAFGQTGKTFTMTGPESGWNLHTERLGIIPRALEYLFQQLDSHREESQAKYLIRANYLEIYNELVQDLLSPLSSPNASLPVRWTAERGFYVEHAITVECLDLDDCMAVLEEGLKNRTTGAHRLNEYSSRSHSMMTIFIESSKLDALDGQSVVKNGKISFVDLAGSERVRESRAKGDTLTETTNINKSLLTLGNCISALADPKKRSGHIPYRDSNLTKLLSDSLGGTGAALMISCISPSFINLQESLKTLRYAARARKIRTSPIANIVPAGDHVSALRREVHGLRQENAALRAAVQNRNEFPPGLNHTQRMTHLFLPQSAGAAPAVACLLPNIPVESRSMCPSRSSFQGIGTSNQNSQSNLGGPYLKKYLRSTSRNSLPDNSLCRLPPLVPCQNRNLELPKANSNRNMDGSKANACDTQIVAKDEIPSKKSARIKPGLRIKSASTSSSRRFVPQKSQTPPEGKTKVDSVSQFSQENHIRIDLGQPLDSSLTLQSVAQVAALKQMISSDVEALDKEIGLMSRQFE